MKAIIRMPIVITGVLAAALSGNAFAQQPPAVDMDRMVEYAQCIRENGYPEFPDPTLDGRMQLRLEPGSTSRFQAAQRACADKAPPGVAARPGNASPEQLERLIGFSTCMREKGVADFPDPSPQGAFEIRSPSLDLAAPQVQRALQACSESNPVGGLMIQRAP
jgi:hypothetical protein